MIPYRLIQQLSYPLRDKLARSPAGYPEAFPLWNSPHSPCGRGSHVKDMGTLRFSAGFGFCQWAFAAYAPFRPLFHVLLTTPPAGFSVPWKRPGVRGLAPGSSEQRQRSKAGFAVQWNGRKRGQFPLSCSPFSARP